MKILKMFFFKIYTGNVTYKKINKGKQLTLNKVPIFKTGS